MVSSSLLPELLPQWPVPRTQISNSIYPVLSPEGMDQELSGRSRHPGTSVWFSWWFSYLPWHSFPLEMGSSSIQVMGLQAVPLLLFLLSIFHLPVDSFFYPRWLVGEFSSGVYKCEEGLQSSMVGERIFLLSASVGQLVLGSDFFFCAFQNLRWMFLIINPQGSGLGDCLHQN